MTERHRGVVILTANRKEAIDNALTQRLNHVISFSATED